MLFNLGVANNTILSFLFYRFLNYWLMFLFPAAIEQIFNPISELVIPTGIPNKEAKAEIEIYPVIAEVKIRKCSYNLELCKPFCTFNSSIHFVVFLKGNGFLFHLYSLI